ncbi:cbb3-type cytochrome c oxidase subunit II, partial [Neisseria sicca]|uniref:cbb3-type cytochrome c oxidase subunit II n=1 Tax=Neisseria sicca TaxID=490 RepID=UPI0034D97C4C
MILFTLLLLTLPLFIQPLPLFFSNALTHPIQPLKPYNPFQLALPHIYIPHPSYNSHSQIIPPFPPQTQPYRHYSLPPQSLYHHPFQSPSK